ncbi:hypothetical protein WH50_22170 [Pokkaliibacter plantistimulans]|uniref:Probable membrane transporter protein n=2 Tax=Pseudomonadota TaxID=1224 RepID=A0ABX5LWV3_9GAMM|nr:sulfite exporter TauE/SafE family protein [Pokkaliibacter plantistimulans]PPC75892.1 hypothetical protein C4K68_18120 [Pokkaliibacter plantistimulans]PXF29190.1 hypothetical protein WH50_22170 [Pokkaliibacter plantistimulans]
MGLTDSLLTLLIIALGSYMQTLTGFAFGLIVIGGMTLLGLAPIAMAAFVVSFLSLFNSVIALWGHGAKIQRGWLARMFLAAVPTMALGIWGLSHLGQAQARLLEGLLGLIIILCSALMMLKPEPRQTPSEGWAFSLSGMLAGVMGGLFATFGPPVAYIMYRQPQPLEAIRATLQALFISTAIARIAMASGVQQLDSQTLILSLVGMPVVFVATVLGRRYRLPVPELMLRRMAFILLMLTGFSLMISALR